MAFRLKKLLTSTFTMLVLLQCMVASAQEYGIHRRSSLIPDDAIIQYAGSIGFISVGAGYEMANEKIETDLFLGYLPRSIGGAQIWTAAIKANWLPFRLPVNENILMVPLTTGLMVSHTFGPNYFVLLPDNYPKQYYTFSTAVHLYYQLGSQVHFKIGESLPEVGLYYELNSSVEAIYSYIQNTNALSPTDIFYLSLGLRVNLH